MQLSIITPTFNESLNVSKFIASIEKTLKIKDFEIIFVDDNSNDQTYSVVKNIAQSKNYIRCIRFWVQWKSIEF